MIAMAKMPQDCQDLMNNAYAAAVATSAPDGMPNVVCCSMKQAFDDETVLIGNQYMNKTMDNLKAGSKMAVSVWDETHGYQVKGTVTYDDSSELYKAIAAQIHENLAAMGYDIYCKGACFLHVEQVYSITPDETAGKLLVGE